MNMSDDLNDVITSAVKARVEASVLEALSGDQFYGQMVAGALAQKVEVRNGYDTRKTTFLAHVLESVIKESVQNAAKRLVAEQAAEIEEAVRKELRRSSADLAKQLVGSMSQAAESAYGIRVSLEFPRPGMIMNATETITCADRVAAALDLLDLATVGGATVVPIASARWALTGETLSPDQNARRAAAYRRGLHATEQSLQEMTAAWEGACASGDAARAENARLRDICDDEAIRVAWWIVKAQDVTDRWRDLTGTARDAVAAWFPYGLADALDELCEHGADEIRRAVVTADRLARLTSIAELAEVVAQGAELEHAATALTQLRSLVAELRRGRA